MSSTGGFKGGKCKCSRWREFERGEDEAFEFTTLVVPLVIMIMLIAFATLVRSKQMPAWSAASECARAAIESLDADTGKRQGKEAAEGMLAGNYVDPSMAQIVVTGTWEPDTPVTCNVSYSIDVSDIPGFAELTGGAIQVNGAVTLRTEPYKSRWGPTQDGSG
jgi:Flp pilus assembly protein TadG